MSEKIYSVTEELIEELEMRGHYLMQIAHDLKLIRKTKDINKINKKIQFIEKELIDENGKCYIPQTKYKDVKKTLLENIEFQIEELQKINIEILKRKF